MSLNWRLVADYNFYVLQVQEPREPFKQPNDSHE